MPHRLEPEPALFPFITRRIASALRETFRAGYGRKDLRADVLAGITVGIVALPLSMALAIASGVPPQHGLYTAIVGGAIIALLGGARFNVSGPTAAFVVILAPIAHKYGIGGLLLATAMAGVLLVIMGSAGLGQLIQFIPYPVTTGFTAGIAVVIGTLQFKDFFGLTPSYWPEHFMERVYTLILSAPTLHWPDFAVGLFTLVMLLAWPRLTKAIPAPLVAPALGAVVAWAIIHWIPDAQIATIGNRFSYIAGGVTHSGIPPLPPTPVLPWTLPGADGQPLRITFDLIKSLSGSAFAIAILGAIESLLCAVVADGITGTKHDPDAELIAQGVGNIVAPFFGGIAATGALARTATSIRAGARSPIAAVTHSIFLLTAVLALAPLLAYLPMASLAALLIIVAWNMSEMKHFGHILRVAPRSDVAVLLTCFALTVIFDMVVAVSIGVVLAALLFMKRMADISHSRLVEEDYPQLDQPLPKDVILYEIAGPLFFGAARQAMSALHNINGQAKRVILHMGGVPVMDVTGLVALESAIAKLQKDHMFVVLAGVQPQPRRVLKKGGVKAEAGKLAICKTLDEAVALVTDVPAQSPPPTGSGAA